LPSHFNTDNTTNIEKQVLHTHPAEAKGKSEVNLDQESSKIEHEESKVQIDTEHEVKDPNLVRYQSLWTIQNYLSNPLQVRTKQA